MSVEKFEVSASVEDERVEKHSRNGSSQKNINLVRQNVVEPKIAIKRYLQV